MRSTRLGRWSAVAAVMLLSRPAVADACETSGCRRWSYVELRRGNLPRDAAVVLVGAAAYEMCTDEFRRFASVAVRRGDEVVPGAFELLVGSSRTIVWRPDQPFMPGAYTMTVEIDNAGIDRSRGIPEDPPGSCGPDTFVEDVAFTVVDEASPFVAPSLAPPTFEIETRPLDTSFRGLACCDGAAPQQAIGSDCTSTIGGGDCTYLYDYDYLKVGGVPFAEDYPGLWLYQLVVDGEVAARGTSRLDVRRGQRVCAHFEAIHFGTGKVVSSEVACPPDDMVVGPTAHGPGPFEEPTCELLACGTDDGWDPARCRKYDGVHPPFDPAAPMADEGLTTVCEVPEPATMPVYPEPPDAVQRGCGCASTTAPGPIVVTVVVIGLVRRRRR